MLAKEEQRKTLEKDVAEQRASVAELKSHVASLKASNTANQREREEAARE